jgi:hypothetical protein
MWPYYTFPDLPAVPDHFVQESLEYNDRPVETLNPNVQVGHGRNLYRDGQPYGLSTTSHMKPISNEFEAWIKTNITANYLKVGVSSTVAGFERHGPHVDRTREYSLIYQLRSGGADSKTCFWHPLIDLPPDTYYFNNYDDFELELEVQTNTHQWYLIDTKMVHSVENILEGRTSIQISLSPDQIRPEWVKNNV